MAETLTPLEAAITLIGRNSDSSQWAEALRQLLANSTHDEMDQLLASSRFGLLQSEIHSRLDQLDEDRDVACNRLAQVATPALALFLFSPADE